MIPPINCRFCSRKTVFYTAMPTDKLELIHSYKCKHCLVLHGYLLPEYSLYYTNMIVTLDLNDIHWLVNVFHGHKVYICKADNSFRKEINTVNTPDISPENIRDKLKTWILFS